MTETSDVVDAAVAVIASRENAVILTSDIEHLERLAKAAGGEIAVASI
ncbi:MAG: hypothetical protein IT167_28945 [Bryobacterales bacterium]|nr:hypothetical protein [Bryobacterales bacterium]